MIDPQLMTNSELTQSIMDRLRDAVCTEGCDKGVIMLSSNGPTEYSPIMKCQVYKNKYFSELGDALIEVFEGMKLLKDRL